MPLLFRRHKMPRYKVIAPGFINKTLHKPGHPRHGFVVTDKPLKPVPSWLEKVKEETARQKSDREGAAKDAIQKAADDKKDVASIDFGNAPQTVETL